MYILYIYTAVSADPVFIKFQWWILSAIWILNTSIYVVVIMISISFIILKD